MFGGGRRRVLALGCALALLVCLALTTRGSDAQDQPPVAKPVAKSARSTQVALLVGYHGYNAPILQQVLTPKGAQLTTITGWLNPARYQDFGVVVIDGSLKAAQINPCEFTAADLAHVRAFLEAGGTLWLFHQGALTLNTEVGRAFLTPLLGAAQPERRGEPRIQLQHPWVQHLAGATGWVTPSLGRGLIAAPGAGIIEQRPGLTLLHRVAVGEGQLIYVGWDLFRFRPESRSKPSPEQERAFTDQVRILENIARDLYPGVATLAPRRDFFESPYALTADRQLPAPALPAPATFVSHVPTRPLPTASRRALGAGPHRFVDPVQGQDSNAGTQAAPWRTLQHAAGQLQPGDTLVLRGGAYYEHARISVRGTPGQPITIRNYPGEMVILDGGYPEFFRHPATAWEPAPGGVPGEYQSTRTYPDLPAQPNETNVLGHFGDSGLPLHGYRFLADLRSPNEFWTIPSNVGQESAVYCGPGLWFDPQTQRIHCRLAHTTLPGLGADNYAGATDPRQLPLVVAGEAPTLTLTGARHLQLQDLVLRGSKGAVLVLQQAEDITLDGLTVYAGRTGVEAEYTRGLRVIHCAFRGLGAPWSFRSHLKYRAIEAQLFTASKWQPTGNCDFELAYSEFTDCVDGVFIGNVANVRFHHNVVDNITDDALFVTAMATLKGEVPGGPILIYQNRITRCLTAISFGAGHGRQALDERGIHTGQGVWLCRNVMDFRQPLWVFPPRDAAQPQELKHLGRSQGDHGSPIWEPLFVYHNTIIAAEPAWRNYYLHGWGGHANSTVRVLLNNLVLQTAGLPGVELQSQPLALLLDGNVHYSLAGGDPSPAAFHARLAAAVQRAFGQQPFLLDQFPTTLRHPLAPTNAANPVRQLLELESATTGARCRGEQDCYGDPALVSLTSNWREPSDYRLQTHSAARQAGVALPADWFDPLDSDVTRRPDAGAIPFGHPGWRVGVGGRFPGLNLQH